MKDYTSTLPNAFPYAVEIDAAQLGLALVVLAAGKAATGFAVTPSPDDGKRGKSVVLWASTAARNALIANEWLVGQLHFRLTESMRAERNPAEERY